MLRNIISKECWKTSCTPSARLSQSNNSVNPRSNPQEKEKWLANHKNITKKVRIY